MIRTPRGEQLLRTLLLVTGVVTATPALALVNAYALEWTYGVTDPDSMTLALLQHRGMLQLLLGAALVWAAFFRPGRLAAAAAAVVGKATFLLLILSDPSIRSDLALFSTAFDLFCIVTLSVVAVRELRALRARRIPLVPQSIG
ncbi:hypothetical protein SAMN05216266_10457 [Amycolatopsis marina]|uniref:DUF4345 domain-containing protein n=1 Tax=Amycolatopsis marina TaxID=490629 RepID=A0A1I0XVK2_9PSEU|nr:hypothetical protein [Amycolatopsis marina]SFB05149.1 hypothetical protein SAMN05216266_10457 [Amycolatopsis marina]